MQKKLTVALMAAMLASAAFADSGNVTISGYVRAGVQWRNSAASIGGDASEASVDGRGEMAFAGTEDLGNGLSAVWIVRQRFGLDGSGFDENGKTRDGTFGNDRAYVGLKGSFGQIVVGRGYDNFGDGKHDQFVVMGAGGTVGNTIASTGKTTGSGVFGRPGSTTNMVRYNTPNMSGFTGSLQWSTDENKTTTAKASTYTSLRLDYDAADWDIGGGFERKATSTGNTSTYNLTGGAKFGDFSAYAEYQRKKEPGNKTTKAFGVYAYYTIGKVDLGAFIAREKYSFNSDRRNILSLRAAYNLSKRTSAYIETMRDKVSNKDSRNRFMVGMRHAF